MRNIEILDGEYWWGGIVDKGVGMPISRDSIVKIDLNDAESAPDQAMPLLLSSKGRYIWSDKPFKAVCENGNIGIDGNGSFEISEGNIDLKGAYLAAMKKHYQFEGKLPNELFFSVPQYNTWIELNYNQTEENILRYAEAIIANDMPAGIIMIDDGWQEDIGVFKFHTKKFNNPEQMVDKLHGMGFKVMLWLIPLVSPDSETFRKLEKKGFLVKDKNGNTAVRKWWNGYSAVIDLTNPEACAWFCDELDFLMNNYGIDGFKFDGGDPYFYLDEDQTFVSMMPREYTKVYNELGARYAFNEFRASWDCAGKPYVMRLQDKKHSWDDTGINYVIPNSIMQGLMGYTNHCPDMIGGGDSGSDYTKLDEELVVRYAQASALMPMMQFSLAPWRVLSTENFEIVKNAALLHKKYGSVILDLAHNAANTGEPIVRHMAYEFPGEGLETVNNQFMLGSEILVAPVAQKGERIRKVVLPKGRWTDETGMEYEGGRVIDIEVPLNRLPHFFRD